MAGGVLDMHNSDDVRQDKHRMFSSTKFIIDILSFLLVCSIFIIFDLVLNPYERGYFCNDESIRYPFKKSTISATVNYIVWFSVALCLIVITETHLGCSAATRHNFPNFKFKKFSPAIPNYVVMIYEYAGYLFFGSAITKACFDVGKICSGRLRPNFLALCQPEEGVKMFCDTYPEGYVTPDIMQCTGENFYLHFRAKWTVFGTRIPINILQLFCLLYAFVVDLSRISDNKHHPTDVLSGTILGIFVAAFVTFFVARMQSPLIIQRQPPNSEV